MSGEVPKKLGKYEIVRQLGQGAMGIVYEGIDAKLRRPCAIKLIRKDQFDPAEAEEYSRRFLTEAQAAAKLDHVNIVKVFDYDDEEELAYIVMELVRGGKTLKNYFDAKHSFTTVQTVRLMSELLGALEHSHSREVFHRDIKPDNIFVTEAGVVKLGDFGIAKIDTTHKTMVGTVLGTPGYMSPEQFRGEEADGRSDLYSAGVILYQFLVGERPFTGPFLTLQKKVLNDLPRPPSALRPAVSAAIDEVVLKALEKKAEARFQTAAEFIHALAASMGLAESDDESEATMVAAPRLPPLQRPAGGASEASAISGGVALATSTTGRSALGIGATTGIASTTGIGTATAGVQGIRQRAEQARLRAEEELRRVDAELRLAEEAQTQWETLSSAADGLLVSAKQRQLAAQSMLFDPMLLLAGEALELELTSAAESARVTRAELSQFSEQSSALTPEERDLAQRQAKALDDAADGLIASQQRVKAERGVRLDAVLGQLTALDDRCQGVQDSLHERTTWLAAVRPDEAGPALDRGVQRVAELLRDADGVKEAAAMLKSLPLKLPAAAAERIAMAADLVSQVHAEVTALLGRAQAAATRAVEAQQARSRLEEAQKEWMALAAEATHRLAQCRQYRSSVRALQDDPASPLDTETLAAALAAEAGLAASLATQLAEFANITEPLTADERRQAQAQFEALRGLATELEDARHWVNEESARRQSKVLRQLADLETHCNNLQNGLGDHSRWLANLGAGPSEQEFEEAVRQVNSLIGEAGGLESLLAPLRVLRVTVDASTHDRLAAATALARRLALESRGQLGQIQSAAVQATQARQARQQAESQAQSLRAALLQAATDLMAGCRLRLQAAEGLLLGPSLLLDGAATAAELVADAANAKDFAVRLGQFRQGSDPFPTADENERAERLAASLNEAATALTATGKRIEAERDQHLAAALEQARALDALSGEVQEKLTERTTWLTMIGPTASVAILDRGAERLAMLSQASGRLESQLAASKSQRLTLPPELALVVLAASDGAGRTCKAVHEVLAKVDAAISQARALAEAAQRAAATEVAQRAVAAEVAQRAAEVAQRAAATEVAQRAAAAEVAQRAAAAEVAQRAAAAAAEIAQRAAAAEVAQRAAEAAQLEAAAQRVQQAAMAASRIPPADAPPPDGALDDEGATVVAAPRPRLEAVPPIPVSRPTEKLSTPPAAKLTPAAVPGSPVEPLPAPSFTPALRTAEPSLAVGDAQSSGKSKLLLPAAGAALVLSGALWLMLRPSAPVSPPAVVSAPEAVKGEAAPVGVAGKGKDAAATAESTPLTPSKDATDSEAAIKLKAAKDAAAKAESIAKGAVPTDQAIKDRQAKESAAKETQAKDLAAKQAADKDAALKGAAAKDAAAKEAAARDAAAKDVAARDIASKETAAREVAAKEAAVKDQAARDRIAKEAAAKEAAAKDAAAKDAVAKEVAAKDVAAKEAASKEATAKEAAAKEAAKPKQSPAELYQQGVALNSREGVRLLEQAGEAGYGPASKKLMEVYGSGGMGVGKDYTKAVKWKSLAKKQGQDVNE